MHTKRRQSFVTLRITVNCHVPTEIKILTKFEKTALCYWYFVYKTSWQWNCTPIVACGFLYYVADIDCRHLVIPQQNNRLLSCLQNNSIYVCFALLRPSRSNMLSVRKGSFTIIRWLEKIWLYTRAKTIWFSSWTTLLSLLFRTLP